MELFNELLSKIGSMPLLVLALQVVGAMMALYVLPKIPFTKSLFTPINSAIGNVKNAYIRGVLQRLVDLIAQKVLVAENTMIEGLKEKAKDGKLTKDELQEELKKVRDTVLADVKEFATAQGLWDLALKIFMGDESALTKWVGDAMEAVVAKLPASGLQTTTNSNVAPAMASAPANPQ